MCLYPQKDRDTLQYGQSNLGVDWVVRYQFEDLDESQAVDEFCTLIRDLKSVGFQTQVRHGYGASLLVCLRLPRAMLGNMIHRAREMDWLYAISHILPVGGDEAIVEAETPAEELRSVYNCLTWPKELGGAEITRKVGKWKGITASFPLHDQATNAKLLRKWSRSIRLTSDDLDIIRALFGEEIAFYFAFIYSYSVFLIFPATWGIVCWRYFGEYSIACAIVNCVLCVVFIEYWKMHETDLSLRWGTKGVGELKVYRAQYLWDKKVANPITGRFRSLFSAHKQFVRQLLMIPFASVAALALGTLTMVTFAMNLFVSEVYNGPFKDYLETLPTVLFSLSLPAITALLDNIATQLTTYENYRIQEQYDLAQTQKAFVMNFIISFLPTLLVAFIYVPFGAKIILYLDIFRIAGLDSSSNLRREFRVSSAFLQHWVTYFTITGQVLNLGKGYILPHVNRTLRQKWRDCPMKQGKGSPDNYPSTATDHLLHDSPEEAMFMSRIRREAEADVFNAQEDIVAMCVQFGYLALFGVTWPLIPLGFLLNSWLKLRRDLSKLGLECQRPAPVRVDSIGPSLKRLEYLTWLGAISTPTIVHIYRGTGENVNLSSLLLTILVAEKAYLAMRFAVRIGVEKLGSDSMRRNEARRYVVRKEYLDALLKNMSRKLPKRVTQRVRFNQRVDVFTSTAQTRSEEAVLEDADPGDADTGITLQERSTDVLRESPPEGRFWSGHGKEMETADAGVKLIRILTTKMPAGNLAWKNRPKVA